MDTKSKKFSAPLWAKAVACLLILAGCCVISFQVYEIAYRNMAEDYTPTLAKTYGSDNSIAWETVSTQIMALRMGCLLQSEQHIKSGETLSQQRLRNYWKSFFQDHIIDYVNQYVDRQLDNGHAGEIGPSNTPDYDGYVWEAYESGSYEELSEQWIALMDISDFQVETGEDQRIIVHRQGPEATDVLFVFEQYYQARLESIGQSLVEQDLRSYRYYQRYLGEYQQLHYLIQSGGQTFGNATESQLKEYEKSAISMKVENGELLVRFGSNSLSADLDSGYYSISGVHWNAMPDSYIREQVEEILEEAGEIDSAFLWFDNTYVDSLQRKVEKDRQDTLKYGSIISGMGLVCLACLLYLFCVCGRRKGEAEVRLIWLDMLYTELNLLLIGLAMTGFVGLFMTAWETQEKLLLWPASLLGGGIVLALLLSLARRLKDKSLLRNCLIWKLCLLLAAPFRKIAQMFRLSMNQGPYVKKAVWCTIAYGVLCTLCAMVFLFPLSFLLVVLAAIFVYRSALSFQKVQDGVTQVKNGNLSYQIDLSENAAFNDLAADINSIADGLNAAVENELKSERMKSELITNVSHDIRTPLTSVITYIDLLQKEGLDSENAPGYCEIIGQKAQRLKNLTDDLFEVSKAASGNIAVHLEDVDLAALVRQGLGELDDKVAQSGLDFRVNLPAEGLIVQADGKLLWRVIENLLSNVFKYAMPASRVYIDVRDLGLRAAFVIKNISAYELNGVDPEKLVERFQRGDTARHSEGNGLGLAIAKNLAELQKGSFEIVIDGDLFKASVTLPKGKAQKPRQPEPEPLQQEPAQPAESDQPPEQIG